MALYIYTSQTCYQQRLQNERSSYKDPLQSFDATQQQWTCPPCAREWTRSPADYIVHDGTQMDLSAWRTFWPTASVRGSPCDLGTGQYIKSDNRTDSMDEQNENITSHCRLCASSHIHAYGRKPKGIGIKFCVWVQVSATNLSIQKFWSRSVKGFLCEEGSNFPFLHKLEWLSLNFKHYHATAQVSDTTRLIYDVTSTNIYMKCSNVMNNEVRQNLNEHDQMNVWVYLKRK